jgi:hypothetical protein
MRRDLRPLASINRGSGFDAVDRTGRTLQACETRRRKRWIEVERSFESILLSFGIMSPPDAAFCITTHAKDLSA